MALFGGGVEAARLLIGVGVPGADAAGRELAGLGRNVDKAGGQFGLLGPLALGAGAIIVGGMAMAAKAAAEEQVGIVRLTKSLEDNVKGFTGNTDAIEALIGQREKLAFSDDSLRDSLAQLVTRTHDVDKAMQLQATAMDLARLKGIDLETATSIVGKVFSGNVGILARYGIAVDKGATSTQALAAIQASAAGQAEAYAGTAAGAWESFGIVANDLVESLGSVLLPVLTGVAIFARDTLVPAIASGAEVFGKVAGVVGQVLGPVLAWLGQNVMPPLAEAFAWVSENVLPALGAAFGWIAQNVLPPFADGFRVVAQVIGAAVGFFAPILRQVAQVLFPLIAAAAADLFGKIKFFFDLAGKVITALQPIVDGMVKAVIGLFGGMASGIGSAWGTAVGLVRGAVNTIIGAINMLIRAWNSLSFTVPKFDLGPLGTFGGFTISLPKIAPLPYFEKGAWDVPATMPAIVHKGEMVVPARMADIFRSGAGSGTTIINISIGNVSGTESEARRLGEILGRQLRLATIPGS